MQFKEIGDKKILMNLWNTKDPMKSPYLFEYMTKNFSMLKKYMALDKGGH